MPLSFTICGLVLWPLPGFQPLRGAWPRGFRRHLGGITEAMALTQAGPGVTGGDGEVVGCDKR